MNNVNIFGRLTKTPDLKHTSNGTAVTSFSIAVNDFNKATFVPCVAWKNTAEHICRYFTKGQLIGVSGRLSNKPYEKGDVKLETLEVIVNSVDFGDSKKKASADDFEDITIDEPLPF